jgi:excisionase family DNA binding protein
MKNDEKKVLTVEETARILRLGRAAAYAAIASGDIPSIRIGRRILVSRTVLENMLSESNKRSNNN